jgi:hypothetical protein
MVLGSEISEQHGSTASTASISSSAIEEAVRFRREDRRPDGYFLTGTCTKGMRAMTNAKPYPIGTPGQAWGAAERDAWRASRTRVRSYIGDVVSQIDALGAHWDCVQYGQIKDGEERLPLFALRSKNWAEARPTVLVTGGVHGYETSGVHGALLFSAQFARRYIGRANLLIAPCISPWAYERMQRWNAQAVDPNRSFALAGACEEAQALTSLLSPLRQTILMHIDLHETTDTDESEFRPALAARDGKEQTPGSVPDGFYLVGDSENPSLSFQKHVIDAVAQVTHIAPEDARGEIIGSAVVAPGVILYPFRKLGLCAGITDARFATTTEVYPDSPKSSPEQCDLAQATAVCAAIDFALR